MSKKIHIVLSQSGALISKFLQSITKAEYNHVSLSLKEDLSEMYSFGRRWKRYPFYGGFVRETQTTGIFALCPNARACVLSLDVTEEQYEGIRARMAEMYAARKKYKYDYIGLFLVLFKKKWKRKRYYYCSEFLKEILIEFGVAKESDFPYVSTPIDFLERYKDKIVYTGRLRDFKAEAEQSPSGLASA